MPLTKVASSMLASGASGSGGSTGKNYISTYNSNTCNGDFETGSDSGWNLCTVGGISNGVPNTSLTVGTAAGVTKTITSPGSQIAGQYSLQTVFGATTAFQGLITDVFTIDSEDLAKVLTFKFYYQVTSNGSTNSNFSGTSANTFLVGIYDVAASTLAGSPVWIQPTGLYGMTQSSGAGIATGTFQTTATGTQYRLAVLCANSANGAITVVFDDFSVGPQTAPIGSVATDWVDFPSVAAGTLITSTGTTPSYGTTVVNKAQWRRVGDSMEIFWEFKQTSGGGIGTGSYLFSLPAGYSIDTNKIVIPSTAIDGYTSLGSGHIASGTTYGNMSATAYNSTKLAFFVLFDGMGAATQNWGQTQFNFSSSPLVISFNAKVPIAGWSSNVQMSNDTDTRVVAGVGYFNSATLTSSESQLSITSITDTHGAFTSNSYVIPVSGYYQISSSYNGNSSSATLNNAYIRCKIGGITDKEGQAYGSFIHNPSFSYVKYLNAGNILTFFGSTDGGPNIPVGGSSISSIVSVSRLSGPSVIAATETVACEYNSTAANSVANGVDSIYIDFGTKESDTHNAVVGAGSGNNATATNTWRYVAPVSGRYQVNAIVSVTVSPAASIETFTTIAVNGTLKQRGERVTTGSGANAVAIVSGVVKVNAGDYISIGMFQSSGAARNTEPSPTSNRVSIVRVGN